MNPHEKRPPVMPEPCPSKPGQAAGQSPVRGRNLDAFRNDLVALFARMVGQVNRPGT